MENLVADHLYRIVPKKDVEIDNDPIKEEFLDDFLLLCMVC